MKFTASTGLSPTLSLLINKDISVILGGTEDSFGVQGEGPKEKVAGKEAPSMLSSKG